MHKTSIVTNHTVSSDKHIVGNRVSEHLNTQSISDNLFSLLVQIGVDEGDVVVASDTVSQGRQFLFNSDDFDSFRETVPDAS
jgi:hypothetical protein